MCMCVFCIVKTYNTKYTKLEIQHNILHYYENSLVNEAFSVHIPMLHLF